MSFFNAGTSVSTRILDTIEEMGQNHRRASQPRTYWGHWSTSQVAAYNKGYDEMHRVMTCPVVDWYLKQTATDTTP
jgi:hypothetical protein